MGLILKPLRFIACMALTIVTWPLLVLLAANVALITNDTHCPTPKGVYIGWRDGLTELTTSTLQFVKKEIF